MIGYFIVWLLGVVTGVITAHQLLCYRDSQRYDRLLAIREERIAMLEARIEEYRSELGL